MRRRDGFTLVELVIATVVFAIAGLGLAATSAAVARQVSTTTIRDRALSLARSQLESAGTASCSGTGEGEAEIPAVSVGWSADGSLARTIDVRVSRIDARGIFADRILSAVLCE